VTRYEAPWAATNGIRLTPITIRTEAMIRPDVVTGVKSPYPTVAKVTINHQKASPSVFMEPLEPRST